MLEPVSLQLFQSAPTPAIGHAAADISATNPHRADRPVSQPLGLLLSRRSVPLADDGLPLWDDKTFSPSARVRRASLRPQVLLLPVQTRIGSTNVGEALRQYGRILWNIRQKKAPRLGLARKIRHDGVAALGGPRTGNGAEFLKRCKMISRSMVYLSIIQDRALRKYSQEHANTIRDTIDRIRTSAIYGMAGGENMRDAAPEQIMRKIECRISASETNWLAYPFAWAWSKIWC